MRRSLPVALLTVLAASRALAQQAPSASPPAPAASAPAAAATAEREKKEEKKDEAPTNARLAPGGVVTGASSFPLHIQATIDNAIGNGLLAPGYQMQPSWSSSLNLRPSAALPKWDGFPRMLLSGSIDFSVNNWLPAYSNSGVFDRQVRVGDPSLSLILPGIFTEEFTGIGVSLVAGARAPLSISSRQQNLITNVGGAAQFMWNSPETPVGSFFVQYTPSARFSFYSQPGATMPCEELPEYGLVRPSGDPVDGVTDLPVILGRTEEILPNGECIRPGRQTLGTLTNAMATGWTTTDGAHNVSLSLSWTHAFQRALSNRPELASPFSSGQSFSETSSGSVSYTYTVPVGFNLFLSAGVFSQQPAYTAKGDLRFPFWDFFTPANNLSGAFFDVTVGI